MLPKEFGRKNFRNSYLHLYLILNVYNLGRVKEIILPLSKLFVLPKYFIFLKASPPIKFNFKRFLPRFFLFIYPGFDSMEQAIFDAPGGHNQFFCEGAIQLTPRLGSRKFE